MYRPHHTTKSSDEGFTLVEVLIVVGMLALLSAVISAAIIVVFRSEGGIVRVVAESHDTQQGVNYFPLDVQAGPLERSAYTTSAATGCVNEGSNVLQFDKGDKRVAYRLTDSGGGLWRLDRHVCDLPLLTNLERINVADRLDAPAVATLIPAAGVLVDSVELRLAQDGADALVVASPRGEPLNSGGDCQTENPIEAAHGYGTFVEGDVELQDGAMTGWLGLGGTLTWLKDITIASGNMSGVAPEYGLYAEGINWDLPWEAIIRADAQAVTDLDVLGNTATATVTAHGYTVGQSVVVEGTGNSAIDGNAFAIVTVTAPNTFTFSVTTGNVNDLTGTVRAVDPAVLDVLGNTATATVTAHGYTVGQSVVVEGTGNSAIDGNAFAIVTVTAPNTFTFSVTTSDVTGLTGVTSPVDPAVLEVATEKAAIGGTSPAFHKVGDLVYEFDGSTDNYINLSGPGDPPAESTADQIDFPLDFDELRDCAAQLALLSQLCELDGCANAVDVTVTPAVAPDKGTVNACASSPVPQVLDIPEEFFDSNWEFDTSGPGCQGFSQARPLIINVIDGGDGTIDFDATPVDWTALGDRKNILFNFPNTTVLNINGGFWGHIMAPFANVTTNGDIDGGIIARQWTHVDGTVDSNDDLFNNPIGWP